MLMSFDYCCCWLWTQKLLLGSECWLLQKQLTTGQSTDNKQLLNIQPQKGHQAPSPRLIEY